MLILSRKKGEGIIIQGGIRIVVTEIRGDKVRIGIDAPKEVLVHREEVNRTIVACETQGKQTDRAGITE